MFILLKGTDDLNDDFDIRINRHHIETIQFIKKEGQKYFYDIGMLSGRIIKDVYSENNQLTVNLPYVK